MKVDDFIHNPVVPAYDVYIQYKGIFDMQDVYESLVDFFHRRKFKFYEKQQRYRKPGPFGPEVLHQFTAERKVEEFYEWHVNIDIETFDMHEVEVITKEGARKKMMKGRMWVKITGKCVTDYEKIWEKSAFLTHIKSFYNKYIIRKRLESVWWDEFYYNIILKIHALIKERLKMMSEVNETRHHSRTH